MAIAARLRHELVIAARTDGAADYRGNLEQTFDEQDPIRGLIQRRSAREIRGADPADVALSDAIGFVPRGTVVASGDRIAHGASVYQVVGPPIDAGGRGRHLELNLLLVVP